jgi:hypothetical protein
MNKFKDYYLMGKKTENIMEKKTTNSVKKIKTYQGKSVKIDKDDYPFISNLTNRFGLSIDKWGYPKINYKKNGKTKTIKLHRLIMRLHGYKIKGLFVDHKDRNRLNNTKSNLRVVGRRMNNRNRSIVVNY